jgi:hypothetical protein
MKASALSRSAATANNNLSRNGQQQLSRLPYNQLLCDQITIVEEGQMDKGIPESIADGGFDIPAYDAKGSAEARSATFTWLFVGAILYVTLLQHVLPGESQAQAGGSPPTYTAASPEKPSAVVPFVVKCSEPIPEFTLGRNSHPSKAQVQQLCGCIWDHMSKWEKETSRAIVEGRENEVSYLHMRAFPTRFGQRVEECGGKDL